jgi:hypothetical protein
MANHPGFRPQKRTILKADQPGNRGRKIVKATAPEHRRAARHRTRANTTPVFTLILISQKQDPTPRDSQKRAELNALNG